MSRVYHTAHKRAKFCNIVRNLVTELVLCEHVKVTKILLINLLLLLKITLYMIIVKFFKLFVKMLKMIKTFMF